MNLDEVRARAAAATPGPWWAWDRGVGWHIALGKPNDLDEYGRPERLLPEGMRTDIGREEDAEFIAHARTDILNLLALVDALTAENARLRSHQPDVDKLRELAGALNRMHAKRPLANYTGFGDAILAAIGEEPGYMGKPLRFESTPEGGAS